MCGVFAGKELEAGRDMRGGLLGWTFHFFPDKEHCGEKTIFSAPRLLAQRGLLYEMIFHGSGAVKQQ